MIPNMNKNVLNSPFTFFVGGNLCGRYVSEPVYLTCLLLFALYIYILLLNFYSVQCKNVD